MRAYGILVNGIPLRVRVRTEEDAFPVSVPIR